MDNFWRQDAVNDWNDIHSPERRSEPNINPPDPIPFDIRLLDPRLRPANPGTKKYKKEFSQKKEALAMAFLHELDTEVNNGEIARLSQSTGGIKIDWSNKLNSTAGRANWSRQRLSSSSRPMKPDGTVLENYRHYAVIELAKKVIDNEDRLFNTLAHEYCHLCTYMIDNVKNNPHGKEFKAWGAKVTRLFAHRGIEVTTKHTYQIDYKYVWECENCGIEYGRHSKSIDPSSHRCGTCKSRLIQIKPVPRVGQENGGKEKTLTDYQKFVSKHMTRIKDENPHR
jgi:germ cell nuclear acidic protein